MNKIKSYLQNNYTEVIFLSVIVIAACILRIIGIINHGDLWTDELFSLYYAEKPSVYELLHTMYNEDLHSPLYPILLHFWLKISGTSLVAMRISGIFFSILFFPALFYISKNLFNAKTAYYVCTLSLFSGFLIHNSLELRPYALIPILSILATFYFVKFVEKCDKFNATLFIIFDLLLLYTFNIAFIFVFFQFLCALVYFLLHKKQNIKRLFSTFLVLGLFYIPCAIMIFHGIILYNNATADLTESMFPIYPAFLYKIFETYFSALYLNARSNFPFDMNLLLNPLWCFASILPVIIGFIGLFKAIKLKNKTFYLFFFPSFLFVTAELILAFQGSLILLMRYTLIAFPIFITAVCFGLSLLNKKKTGVILFSVLLFINFLSFIFYNF